MMRWDRIDTIAMAVLVAYFIGLFVVLVWPEPFG